jgi:hypothetical protein
MNQHIFPALNSQAGHSFFCSAGGLFDQPARFSAFPVLLQSGNQKKQLPLHIGWHGSPDLLVAVYSF